MTKKIGVVGSMINSSDYLLFKELETGYVLERYEPVVEGFNMISFDSPKTKCRIKDDRCVRKQIAKRRKRNKNPKTHRKR